MFELDTDTVHVDISIDGDTNVAFTENVEQRFQAYGWQVLHVDNGDRLAVHGICDRELQLTVTTAISKECTTPLLRLAKRRTNPLSSA